MQYPLVYMCIWIVPTAVRIYHATGGGQTPLYLNILDKVYISPHHPNLQRSAKAANAPISGLYCNTGIRRFSGLW